MANKKVIHIQRILGMLYALAGISKFSTQLESVKDVLYKASIANKNNLLTIPSQWMSDHSIVIVWFVGLVMIFAGVVLIINRFLGETCHLWDIAYAGVFYDFYASLTASGFCLGLPICDCFHLPTF